MYTLTLTNIISLLLLLLSSQGSHASATPNPEGSSSSSLDLSKRQAITRKYCNPTTSICYLEYSWGPTVPVFRIAVPDSAASNSNFDTLLQIIAPASLGWAGFSWGGGMTLNPLAVAWPNGNNGATVSSRWSTGRTLPSVYSSAKYRTVSASRNSTHWMVETVCSGCSKWNNGGLSTTGVNTFAWAVSQTAVSQPGNSGSSFAIHSNIGMFSESLDQAKVPRAAFEAYVKGAK
ncbi:hypothetical protein C8A00DRAFT_44288 [Chaetomidium leptoderma]|uniref:Cellobiose dehydrogenase-like cytochrome domain-containing protein n=1 Tax=Chaetomidium leptoderma TaxID=669021 RepID=A0AAN6VJG9_9PEZI|nr:hypothetical protein C8A00DRAFT_44288 [Chaetomidium leptoderma]